MASDDRDLVWIAPLAATEDPTPGTLVGEYLVEAKIGEGGMASVFSAVHPVIGKRAAIKVISRRLCSDLPAVQRFVQEARSVNQIGHPNIVDIFAFGNLADGRCYFTMEWLSGESLGDRLRKGTLRLADTLEILAQVSEALQAAHSKEIVHRDLKPDNLYLASVYGRTHVKILDFGLAKLADADATVPRTRSGIALGTAGYMSPEQARGRAVDHRTDVYALGAIAYEMVLGRLPFVGESAIDILAQHLSEPPPRPRTLWPEVPRRLETLLLGMLEKDQDNRPSLATVRAEIAALQSAESPAGRATPHSIDGQNTARIHLPQPPRRWPIAVILVMAAALVGLTLALIGAGQRPVNPDPRPLELTAPVAAPAPVPVPVPAPPPAVAPPAAVAPAPGSKDAAKRPGKAPGKRRKTDRSHQGDYTLDPF